MESARGRITWLMASTFVILAVLGSRVAYLDVVRMRSNLETFQDTGMVALPDNDVLRAMSLGFEPFVSDMLFMQANNYFTSRFQRARSHEWLDRYFAAVVGYCRLADGQHLFETPEACPGRGGEWEEGLFPFNPRLYLWATQSIKYAAGAGRSVIDIVLYMGKTGISYCPDSWELYYDVGVNLYTEHDSLTPAEKDERRKEALDYFVVAASLPNSGVGHSFVSYISGIMGTSVDVMRQVYTGYFSSEEEERFQLRSQLVWQNQKDLAKRYEDADKTWEADKPYLPQSVYHVLGTKQKPQFTYLSEVRR